MTTFVINLAGLCVAFDLPQTMSSHQQFCISSLFLQFISLAFAITNSLRFCLPFKCHFLRKTLSFLK